jgi:hypothetical protein
MRHNHYHYHGPTADFNRLLGLLIIGFLLLCFVHGCSLDETI